MFKKIIYMLPIIFLVTSCANTYDSVKRGLSGTKAKSTDEFMVQKKDPLILPPDYENLPEPGETINSVDEILSFEKTLGIPTENNSISSASSSSSTESLILKKIQSK